MACGFPGHRIGAAIRRDVYGANGGTRKAPPGLKKIVQALAA
jgi:hypothetical protein